MRRTKEQKGITLIALIITIVVLLILAAVAISSITNDGILSYAQKAAKDYNQAVKNEQDTLQEYMDFLNNGGSTGSKTKTVVEVKNVIQTSNTKVIDEYGNQIVIPAGFKIRVDEGTRTKGDAKSTATHVTEGIVIEDASGNQFVWVPVGKIYTDTAKTESLVKTITLGRYDYYSCVPDANGVYTPATSISSYTEDTAENHDEEYENAIARNIEDFKTSATQNKGYYIGRFEAGNSSNTLVCKTGQTVYVDITQSNASTACKNMYNNGADGYKTNTFSSDLINSYAWDTAIIFIQTFGGEAASDYYQQNASEEIGELKTTTGTTGDEYCNINDMSGNASEWSTETSNETRFPCVFRGGYYFLDDGYPIDDAWARNLSLQSNAQNYCTFRPLLYVAL